jgi:pSer/pThr/pTyr-binding forkhead associated (FHA) protein
MATTTRFPQPAGPFTADPITTDPGSTDALASAPGDVALDALALIDHTTRARTIRPELALRGSYLAFGDGNEMRLLPLDQRITHIGRGGDAQVRLEEHHVSRDHAILVRHGHYFRLLDNRSANGTFLNGRRIVATNVSDGDVIRVGPLMMRFFELR